MADSNKSASSYVLRYFNIHGLGEVIRLLLTAAKVEWTEEHPEWPKDKSKQPYGHVPVLLRKNAEGEVDLVLTESQVIERFLAHKHGFLPTDVEQSALHEQIRDRYIDLWRVHMDYIKAFDIRKDDLAAKYEDDARKLVELHSELLRENGSNGHFFGDNTTYVDLATYAFLKFFRLESSRALERKLNIFTPENAPEFQKLYETVEADPALHPYFAAEKDTGVRILTSFQGYSM
ncbi:hypothetical protein GGI12_005267 [Dipsacomyces acuminosporus]|nr:hypothetical protein GGI12_005267 [Dipsacomyces acuminosporus]